MRINIQFLREDDQLLATLGRSLELPRAMARNGQSFGISAEAVDVSNLRLDGCRSHFSGLPEQIGDVRNWDCRFTWIRDASLALYALMRMGYTGAASAFMRWLEARIAELEADGSLQVIYGVDDYQKPMRGAPHADYPASVLVSSQGWSFYEHWGAIAIPNM